MHISAKPYMPFMVITLVFCSLFAWQPGQAAGDDKLPALTQLIAGAHPGQVISVPAGRYRGGVVLPPGVSLKGAGYQQTIIDATGSDTGIAISGGQGASVSGLTVSGARVTGIAATNANALRISAVRVTGSMVGLNIDNAQQPRVENTISDHNRYGIVLNHSTHGVVVNCTVADCEDTALQFPTGEGTVAFNNVMANVSTGINIGASKNNALDYNLYVVQFVGKMDEQIARTLLIGWQSLSGFDAHSVQLPVTFRDAANGDYTPTATLPWAQDRLTTAGWGLATYAGVKAPKTDINDGRWQGGSSLGAVTGTTKAPRPADGQFTVTRGDGPTSAGVFTRDGVLLTYLFHNLPLAKGTYRYWLPTRDYAGRPIAAGSYEVRMVESKLRWQYLNHIGDNGEDAPISATASFNPVSAVFVPGGVVMGEGPSEDHTNLRCFSLADRKLRWTTTGGNDMRGVALGSDGYLYCLRTLEAKSAWLTRYDVATGQLVSWGGEGYEHLRIFMGKGMGLAVLGGKLYTVADGKLVVLDITALLRDPAKPDITATLPVATPSCPAADASTNCLWVISAGKLVALAPDGAVRATVSPVEGPVAISAVNGTLAVASYLTGKVHLFDAHDPANLKPLRTVGTGDGPYGAFALDRFLFKHTPNVEPVDGEGVGVALSQDGDLAVVDANRFITFDKQGAPRWYTFGIFGNRSEPSFSTNHRRLWDPITKWSFRLDAPTGQWAPEAYWDFSAIPHRSYVPLFLGDFAKGGKTYVVYGGFPDHPAQLVVARLDGYRMVPVYMMVNDPAHAGQVLARKDINHDGLINEKDGGETVMGPDGKPLSVLFQRFQTLQENGDILISMDYEVLRWKCMLDADGTPIYRGQDRMVVARPDEKTFINPYDGKPGIGGYAVGPIAVADQLPGGGYTLQAYVRGSGGAGLNNGGGTDLIGIDAKGSPRWIHQLAPLHGIAGLGTANGVSITSAYSSGQYLAFDDDGLGLGGFTEAAQLHFCGYWIDSPNLQMYRGPDGHAYVTVGSNVYGSHLWYRQTGEEQCLRKRIPCTVSAQLAATLAALPAASAVKEMKPPQPRISVPRLAAPFPIDGTLEKWRKAGVPPQILMPPGEGGAAKSSAMIRLAYEGQNIYVQVLQFDDVPIFSFGLLCPVWQDCVEMGINGATEGGFQFLANRGPDGKTNVWRNRFFSNLARAMDTAHTPCSVTVLPDAGQVPERAELEALWGADLSKSKVIVTEYKIPLDAQTYAGAEADVPQLGPGKSIWVGFFIDDGDIPGEETQHVMGWPSTFGFFSTKEDGALAICE